MRLNLIPVMAALLLSGCAPVQTTVNPAVLPAATDFGAHENPMEWWYVSSYLPGEGLALHWAQFRVRDPRVPFPVFISHVAVTDMRSGQVTFLEQSPDTGEVAFPPLRIRQGAWTLTQAGPQPTAPMTLKSGPLDLTLTPVKEPVLHPPGFSGSADTGVLFYQGITRLTLTGSVNGRAVQGEAWLDHQWGNQIPGQTALWDWFSVQLDGGRDLMVYRVRRLDGTVAQLIGSVVEPDGSVRAVRGLRAVPGEEWISPQGRKYTLGWQLVSDEFDLTVRAVRREQELLSRSTRIAYWEGPIEISGVWAGEQARGTGMMELVSGTWTPR
ncbi:lipocalin family protein [Deinococcus sp. 23YEL01]|uniref:lipocalin family protein n=1 Tax=Deinococcus sp. 23YEL01 TaxID=2745871 RepID=UPI001E3E3375|nr:lipocalin family protein [Deinococcus sp. 23YEL01]MCD0168987.1 carotenoid 1,2-hydratase [Deinococcus sp. 23YEL01]